MKKQQLDLKTLPVKFKSFLKKSQPYVPLVFIVLVAVMYGFLVFQIRSIAGHEPSDDAITEKLKTVQRPKLDQDSINKLQQLQDNSTNVQALFKQARDNPFQE